MNIVEPNINFDREKLLDVIHFICEKRSPEDLGNVKLHKILYFSDMIHYVATGKPLTGVEYLKQSFGPIARHLTWGLSELENRGVISISKKDYFGFPKLHIDVNIPLKTNRISRMEQDILGDVVEFVCSKSAREISDLSHNAAWDALEIGERIPYLSAFMLAPPREVSDEDIAWGVAEAERVFGHDELKAD